LSRSPVTNSTIYAVFCCYQAYKSVDDGVTFTLQGTLPSGANRIVADPSFVNTAYAYTSQTSAALLKTTDGGVTWNPLSSGLPSATPNIFSMVTASDGSLYVDINLSGVYKSTNQGASWVAVNTGLGSISAAPNGLAGSASSPEPSTRALART